jgi:hypothetical protein
MTSIQRIAAYGRALFAGGVWVIAAIAVSSMPSLWGQATNVFPSSGNVGIGTTNPGQKLEVGDTNAIKLGSAYISSGIPSANHAVFSSNALYIGGAWIIPNATTNSQVLQFYNGGTYFAQTQTPGGTDWQFRLVIASNGNLGIGTANPGQCGGSNTQPCLLTVNGAIGAKEVVVTNGITADYVFDSDYRLRPLQEIAAYIQEHHHLPEIPSAAEVKEKGVSLGEMQAKLLAKIEELTLHLIQADEKNRELQERMARLEAGGR